MNMHNKTLFIYSNCSLKNRNVMDFIKYLKSYELGICSIPTKICDDIYYLQKFQK